MSEEADKKSRNGAASWRCVTMKMKLELVDYSPVDQLRTSEAIRMTSSL
jgi:hypothetical protein